MYYLSASIGINAVFVQTLAQAPNCPSYDPSFGNIILFRGSYVAYAGFYLPNPGKNCNSPTTECRGYICSEYATLAGYLGGCSAHFDRKPPPYPENRMNQANDYLVGANAYLNSVYTDVRSLNGDFNLLPAPAPFDSQSVPSAYWVYFSLADFGYTVSAGNPQLMYDYIWINQTSAIAANAPYCDTAASDHCYVYTAYNY
jgi:hypothetical protein